MSAPELDVDTFVAEAAEPVARMHSTIGLEALTARGERACRRRDRRRSGRDPMIKESTIALLTLLLLSAAPAPPPSVCPPWGAPALVPPVPCCPANTTALYYERNFVTCVPDEPPPEDSYRHNASPS